MTKTEARRFARQCLCNYREDLSRLEQKILKKDSLSSLKGIEYGNEAGKTTAGYVDSVPWWLEAQEELERAIRELTLRTRPITRLLERLRQAEDSKELYQVYVLRWENRLGWTAAMIRMQEHGVTERGYRRLEYQLVDMAISFLDIKIDEASESWSKTG